MFGKNPIRGLEPGDGSILLVQEIFYTIQGEGPYSGMPAVFIRLGGCNLACAFCDTEFESFKPMALEEISIAVKKQGQSKARFAVITGGEPLRQNIAPLCEMLIKAGFLVQIETNGTLFRPLPDAVKIVCSPKNLQSLRPDLLARLDALKFVVSERVEQYKNVPDLGQNQHEIPVYVQPMDEHDDQQNRINMKYAAEMAKANGYMLSIQLHKVIGIA